MVTVLVVTVLVEYVFVVLDNVVVVAVLMFPEFARIFLLETAVVFPPNTAVDCMIVVVME